MKLNLKLIKISNNIDYLMYSSFLFFFKRIIFSLIIWIFRSSRALTIRDIIYEICISIFQIIYSYLLYFFKNSIETMQLYSDFEHRSILSLFIQFLSSVVFYKKKLHLKIFHSFRNNGHPYLSIHRYICISSRTKLSLSNSFIRENVKRYELRYSLFLSITLLCINNKLRIKILF